MYELVFVVCVCECVFVFDGKTCARLFSHSISLWAKWVNTQAQKFVQHTNTLLLPLLLCLEFSRSHSRIVASTAAAVASIEIGTNKWTNEITNELENEITNERTTRQEKRDREGRETVAYSAYLFVAAAACLALHSQSWAPVALTSSLSARAEKRRRLSVCLRLPALAAFVDARLAGWLTLCSGRQTDGR